MAFLTAVEACCRARGLGASAGHMPFFAAVVASEDSGDRRRGRRRAWQATTVPLAVPLLLGSRACLAARRHRHVKSLCAIKVLLASRHHERGAADGTK